MENAPMKLQQYGSLNKTGIMTMPDHISLFTREMSQIPIPRGRTTDDQWL